MSVKESQSKLKLVRLISIQDTFLYVQLAIETYRYIYVCGGTQEPIATYTGNRVRIKFTRLISFIVCNRLYREI